MKRLIVPLITPFFVSFFMTLVMSFTGTSINFGYKEHFWMQWFKSFFIMLPVAFLSSIFIIPFVHYIVKKILVRINV